MFCGVGFTQSWKASTVVIISKDKSPGGDFFLELRDRRARGLVTSGGDTPAAIASSQPAALYSNLGKFFV